MKQLQATVHGRVQGVSFRYYTVQEARRLNLTGWVSNQPDGTVQVVAEGPETNLQQLLAFLERGSPLARVERVQSEWRETSQAFPEFRVRYGS